MPGDIHLGESAVQQNAFYRDARRFASLLHSYGAREDGVVALLMRNSADYLIAMMACRYVGCYYVGLNWHAAPPEIAEIIEDSGANLLLGHSDLLSGLPTSELSDSVHILSIETPASILSNYGLTATKPESSQSLGELIADTAEIATKPKRFRGLLAYTSGSTGKPKGIRRVMSDSGPDRYENFKSIAQNMLGLRRGDRLHIAAPLYHSAPNSIALFALALEGIDLFLDSKFDAERFLWSVEEYKLTHAYIVPTMMVRLLKLPKSVRECYDLSSLRFTLSTGSPCPTEVKTAMVDWLGPIFYESYGSSELGFMTLISAAEASLKPGSVGKVLSGGSIRILDDELNEVDTGCVGTIYISLPSTADFRYSNAEGDLEGQHADGHSSVGDMGYLDEDGYLFINDRKKDMIISGGANIFPAEIESILIRMKEVTDCAVVSAPDPEFGESIVAVVSVTEGTTLNLQQVREFLSKKLASFKLPQKLDIYDSLPREDSGKIYKKLLRAKYWSDVDRSI